MTATLVKFPFEHSRRAFARLPRKSKNGTPKDRAAKRGAGSEDPIFAAIERHRRLWIEFGESAGGGDDLSDAACDAASEALADMAAITPTTIPGCAAMLRYVHQVTAVDHHGSAGELFGGYTRVHPVAADLLLRIADRIEAVQS